MIDLCLLGSGGGMPMPYRNLSSTIINIEGRKILIDCGEGTQVSMRIAGTGFKAIDVICITHCHGDHIVGLPGLLSTIGNSGRTETLTIIGPEGIREVVHGLLLIVKYLPYEINIIENPQKVNLDISKNNINVSEEETSLILSTLQCDHSSPCLGYSFYLKRNRKFLIEKALKNKVPKKLWGTLQQGKSVEYEDVNYSSNLVLGEKRRGIKLSLITDSRPLPSMLDFIKESDLFICEGTYGDNEDIEKAIKNKHMTFKESATLAQQGRVQKLLLTHFSPAMLTPQDFLENATTVFENTILGEDRLMLSLHFQD